MREHGGGLAKEHARCLRQTKATESGRGYSHHLDNQEGDECGKDAYRNTHRRGRTRAAMEEDAPVCDRFLTLGRFAHATDDFISYRSDPE